MYKLMKRWRKTPVRCFLQAMTFLVLISGFTCYAQYLNTCMPPNDLTFNGKLDIVDPNGKVIETTMWPIVWYPGQTYQVSIYGGFPVIAENTPGGCPNVFFSAWQWPDYPYPREVGGMSPDVTLSNLTYVSPTLSTYTVSVSKSAQPGERLFLQLNSWANVWMYWEGQIENPPPPIPPSPPSPPRCPVPTITSVTPSTWIAGKTYPITVTGTGFVTAANPDACPVSIITVSVNTGTVTLSNVNVIDSTTITATVTPADTDPEEPAEVILWVPNNIVIDDDDDIEDGADLTPQAGQDKPVANALGVGVPPGYMMAGEIPAQISNLKAEITDTSNIVNGVVTVKLTGPSGTTGDLTLEFSATNQNYRQTFPGLTPGPHTLKLSLPKVPPETYDSVNGGGQSRWIANVPGAPGAQEVDVPSSSFEKDWTYLGQIRFSQYNASNESSCSGLAQGTQSMYILTKSNQACDYETGQLNSLFVEKVLLNGTGLSVMYGLLKPLGTTDAVLLCSVNDLPPNADSTNTFVKVTSITGSCNTTITADHSVATYPNPKRSTSKLLCNNRLNLDESDNTTAATRVVADLCPGCNTDFGGTRGHIDSYTDNQGCDARPGNDDTVTDFGKYYTSTVK